MWFGTRPSSADAGAAPARARRSCRRDPVPGERRPEQDGLALAQQFEPEARGDRRRVGVVSGNRDEHFVGDMRAGHGAHRKGRPDRPDARRLRRRRRRTAAGGRRGDGSGRRFARRVAVRPQRWDGRPVHRDTAAAIVRVVHRRYRTAIVRILRWITRLGITCSGVVPRTKRIAATAADHAAEEVGQEIGQVDHLPRIRVRRLRIAEAQPALLRRHLRAVDRRAVDTRRSGRQRRLGGADTGRCRAGGQSGHKERKSDATSHRPVSCPA